jgi:hypothetical protein
LISSIFRLRRHASIFLLARYRIVHIAKVLDPNQAVQIITFRKTVYFSIPMLVQTADNIIRDSNVQSAAVFVGKNVNPIVVIAHASGKNQRCFASLNMTSLIEARCHSERSEESQDMF